MTVTLKGGPADQCVVTVSTGCAFILVGDHRYNRHGDYLGFGIAATTD